MAQAATAPSSCIRCSPPKAVVVFRWSEARENPPRLTSRQVTVSQMRSAPSWISPDNLDLAGFEHPGAITEDDSIAPLRGELESFLDAISNGRRGQRQIH